MSKDNLLDAVIEYCKTHKMAESTFGRKAVNDGKFVSRLRTGARVTPETWEKVNKFMNNKSNNGKTNLDNTDLHVLPNDNNNTNKKNEIEEGSSKKKNFRFFDNRQKYLLFVSTCSEKEVVSKRIGMELGHVRPKPPALRIFDAGMGDGSLLMSVMRQCHQKMPNIPLLVSTKEISMEDVRLGLEKLPDRFAEHKNTVFVISNLNYVESTSLKSKNLKKQKKMNWKVVKLKGNSSLDFSNQLRRLNQEFLAKKWQVETNPKTGTSTYKEPSVIVIFRKDQEQCDE